MYAGTTVNWHEVLMPRSNKAVNDDSLPLFLCVFSSEKGTENITDYTYSDFIEMYGRNADFFKYGQPLLQAHKILAAGGRVLGKRIVAEDATLANMIIVANVTSVTEQKKDKDGNPLYSDDNIHFSTDPDSGKAAMITYAKIKYTTETVPDAKTLDEVYEKASELFNPDYGVYPLFVIADNGRGTSNKRIRIVPDYMISKKLPYMVYRFVDIENGETIEVKRFAMDPTSTHIVNADRRSMILDKNTMVQLDAKYHKESTEAFMEKLHSIIGSKFTPEVLYSYDILFGKTLKGKEFSFIEIDYDPNDDKCVNLQSELGLELVSGSNGSGYSKTAIAQSKEELRAEMELKSPLLADAPFLYGTPDDNSSWTQEAINFINGTFSAEIFDLDQHKIDFCVDAAYPDALKLAIVDLADFREDFFYFRDLGLNIGSMFDVTEKVDDLSWPQSKFVGDYMSTYDIIEPFSHKQVKVTMTYGIAPLLVNHYITNAAAPIAGEFNNFIITDAIIETLNIIPRVTPTYDEKEVLDDLKVNFANLTSNYTIAVQSTYTSQDHIGPLSYSNNVIITQMLIKAIRRYCPKIRFMLMDPGATDFGKYKTLIEDNVIARYAKHFKHVELRYTRDDEQIISKIFNASLYCYYRDFPQAEVFDVFAIEGSPDSNPIRDDMR